MKNKFIKRITTKKYSSGESIREYYQNQKGRWYGPWKSLYFNGKKDAEGSFFNGRWIGVWNYWYSNRNKWWIETRNNGARNGVKINFNYEK